MSRAISHRWFRMRVDNPRMGSGCERVYVETDAESYVEMLSRACTWSYSPTEGYALTGGMVWAPAATGGAS